MKTTRSWHMSDPRGMYHMLKTCEGPPWRSGGQGFNAGAEGSIPGWGAKIPQASQPKHQNIKQQKQHCNKFNKKMVHTKKKKSLQKNKNMQKPEKSRMQMKTAF